MPNFRKSHILPIFALFLFSGATSLAYEVIWTRMLIRSFGATSLAVSTVLAAYMAGLALGSYVFGRIIDRRGNPVLIYGLLELGIGMFALGFPWILNGLNPIYRAVYPGLHRHFYALSLVRFALSFIILLVPTTLMGGTLPVLSKYVTRNLSNLTMRVGWLYAINTFGAVAGTFATGFLLMPTLGMSSTTHVAIAANIVIFAASLLLSRGVGRRRLAQPAQKEVQPRQEITVKERIVLVAFLCTGLAALSAEVIWSRVLTLVVGTTVYALATMLTTFLLGLAIGSAIFARIAQRTRRPGTVLAWLVIAIGFCVFASTVFFGKMPFLYMHLYETMPKTWTNVIWVQFLLSLSLMIVPTFLMGGTFPLVARIYATDLARVGGRIGTAYAFNTIGSICGSFIGSFLLLRFLGVENGMIVVSATYVAVGLVLWLTVAEKVSQRLRLAGVGAVVSAIIVSSIFSPRWDERVMTSAVYVYAPLYKTLEGFKQGLELRHVLFYDEGPGATVSVDRMKNVLTLRIDGKADASSGSDMITQELISHLPMAVHAQPDTVLVIGLGSGVSLGSVETYDVKHIECVELLDNVIRAAAYFDSITRSSSRDPRVNLIAGDGRNHLALLDQKYDVIVSEPTNVWISGVGDLFTREFFELAKVRLKPHGVMSAWVHTYHMGPDELRSALKTFASVFPNCSLWFANEGDLIMVGALDPIRIDSSFVRRLAEPSVAEDLYRVGIDGPEDILSALLLDGSGIRRFTQGDVQIHTDDNLLLEYQSARRLVEATHVANLRNLVAILKPVEYPHLGRELNRLIQQHMIARSITVRATLEYLAGDLDAALIACEQAYQMAPGDPYVASKYVERHLDHGDRLLASADYEGARKEYEKATVEPRHMDTWSAYHNMGVAYLYEADYETARSSFERAIELNPYSADSYYNLGQALAALGDTVKATASYEKAYELKPEDAEIANGLAWYYAIQGEHLDKALEIATEVVSKDRNPIYLDTLGWIHFLRGDLEAARKVLEEAISIDKHYAEGLFHLARVQLARGDDGAARQLLRRVVELDSANLGRMAEELLNELGNEVR